jgi:hypothetical protein
VLQDSSELAGKPRPPLPLLSDLEPSLTSAHLPDKVLLSLAPQNEEAATPGSHRLQQHLRRAIAGEGGSTRTPDFAIIFASMPPILW